MSMENLENYKYDPEVPEACIIQREDGRIVFVSLERNPAIRYINTFIHKQAAEEGCMWRQVDTSVICMDEPTVYLMFQNKNVPAEYLKLIEFPIS